MATLLNPNISTVPAATGPGAPAAFPGLTSITVADLVGPSAANRQPNQLDTRSETLRTRSNDLIANSNQIATGGAGGTILFLARDGSDPMTGALDMGTNLINNLVAGVGAADAIRKDQAMLLDGSQAMTANMDMGGNRITNLGAAAGATDALTQADGDSRYVNVLGDTMAGVLSMGSNKIIALADPNPANPAEALNIGFADGRYVNTAGDTMAGVLDMGSNKITNLADPNPANPNEALNIGFADGRYSAAASGFLFGDSLVDGTTRTTNSSTFVDIPLTSITVAAANLPANRTVHVLVSGEVNSVSNLLDIRIVVDGVPRTQLTAVPLGSRFGMSDTFRLNSGTTPVIKLQFRNPVAKLSPGVVDTHVVIKLAE